MLFVEEKDFNQQIRLLSFIANAGDYNICAWLYPKSLATKIAGFIVSNNQSNLIPVTKYLISKNLPPNVPSEAQTGVHWYFNPSEICYANE